MKWIPCTERLPDKELDNTLFVKAEVPHDNPAKFTAMWIDGEWCDAHYANGMEAKMPITHWLDESDHSDEEAAFNAGRWIEVMRSDEREYIQNAYGYPTFTDYLKSKQEL